jgi:hypothetical protein
MLLSAYFPIAGHCASGSCLQIKRSSTIISLNFLKIRKVRIQTLVFLQAKFPSIVDSDDPYPWGAVQPGLLDSFDILSTTEEELAREVLDRKG